MNAPANISYEDRLKARYAAAKAQTFPARPMARGKPANAQASFCEPKKPTQQKPPMEHDAHMQARMVWKAWIGAPMSPKQYFIAACWFAGYTPEVIQSPSRMRRVVTARKAIIRSLAQRFPKMSSNAMEPLLKRDHTTILYCMGQTQRGVAVSGKALRKRGKFNPPLSDEVRARCVALRKRKLTYVRIGELLGIAPSAARYSVMKHNERMKHKATDTLKRAA